MTYPYLYISCPVILPTNTLITVRDKVRLVLPLASIRYWKRKTPYSIKLLNMSSVFILMTPCNMFKFSINELPTGVGNELKRAKELGIPCFLAYCSQTTGQYNFYILEEKSTDYYSGIPGSTHEIYKLWMDIISRTDIQKKSIEKIEADNRILLMI